MARSIGLAHIMRNPDRTATGLWGPYVLKTAFQAIFAFRKGKLEPAAFESLARPFKENGPLSPGTFFGLVPAPDRLHLETLLRTQHLLNAGTFLPDDALIFLNIDPSVFIERSIVEMSLREMRLVLHEAGIDPRRVVCEVTEQRLSGGSTLHYFIDALRADGFRIAVDDYGAESSDAERVNALKPDIVKFDAQWLSPIMGSGPGAALLRTMVNNFRDRGIETVFEGVEEGWQLDLSAQAGASMVQGFILSRPEIVPDRLAQLGPAVQLMSSPSPRTERQESEHVAISARSAGRGRVFGRRAAS
ncbi:EAL domain-containing protein [Mesorhizobium sp. RP14(2022)]|uniref:EAL domain-containing protein n=1 Tax=Mesorhizobium liriopis TaxID=2953882 RepID=A0ABT1C529_9HYPH|nr:EAL domain-containing protein [Mesorhizobium liriopis]